MPYETKPNEGGLWPAKTKTGDKSPDFTGVVGIDRAVLMDLIEKTKAGQPAKIRIIGYENTTASGSVWFKIYSHKDEMLTGGGRAVVRPTNRPPARPARTVAAPVQSPAEHFNLDDEIPF